MRFFSRWRRRHDARLTTEQVGKDVIVRSECSCGWKGPRFSVLEVDFAWSKSWDGAKAHMERGGG